MKTLSKRSGIFCRISQKVAEWTGSAYAFISAVGIIIIWGITGPIFHYSDTWQLVINTGTTIITFLMVFLIQSTQNRDTMALQLKLDELIRVTEGAHLALLDLEELSDKELSAVRRKYIELAEDAREKLRRNEMDTGSPDIALSMSMDEN